jgi:hypothetical protein
MKIKQIVAGGLAAAATLGVTLFGAFGAVTLDQGLEPYVAVTDTTLSSPAIVIGGSNVNALDVLGSADIAASMVSHYAVEEKTVPAGGATVGVSDGVSLATSNTNLYLADSLTKDGLKTTLTKSDLPTVLSSGTVYDDSGTTHPYDQYINMLGGTISFGKSAGDLTDPDIYIDFSTGNLYNASVVFNKILNVSSTDVQGNAIELFGKTYTVGSGSSDTKLVLFGGANVQTFDEGETKTVTVGGTDYTVKLIGVSSSTVAVIEVDGTSKEVTQGSSYTIAGLDVYVDSVFFFTKEAQVSSAKLSFGSAKLTLENGQSVKVGTAEDTVDGTYVGITSTAGQGISKFAVQVSAPASDKDYILRGSAFEDPVFGSFKVAFHGVVPTFDSDARDPIYIDNSGTTGATVKFTDYYGNEKTLTFAYNPTTASFNPGLNATSTKQYHVVEGAMFRKNDYILLTPTQESEFSHVYQLNSYSGLGTSSAYVELLNVLSGIKTKVYLTDNGNYGGTAYIDGQAYYVNTTDISTPKWTMYWGSNAAYGNAGDKTTAFPLVMAAKGEWITFFDKDVSVTVTASDNTTVELPTGDLCVEDGVDTLVYAAESGGCDASPTNYAAASNASATGGAAVQLGTVYYNVTGSGGTTIAASVAKDSTGVEFQYPGVLVLEENDEASVKNAVMFVINKDASNYMTIATPVFTWGAASLETWESDSSISSGGDYYGTFVVYDSDNQGKADVYYPDDQAIAGVGIGSDPSFSTGTATVGGTYNEAVPITNTVAKLASEIPQDTTLNQDIILVGGPCANSIVETLLAADWNVSSACDYWLGGTDADLAAGNGLIKVVEDVFGSGQKALIVAGTNAEDTRALIGNYVIKPTKMATLTGGEYKGSVA